jgi:hypothetical protein
MPTKHPKAVTTKLLALKQIRLDGDTQPREELHQESIDEYAEAYRADAAMPPLVVFWDGTDYWLADGFHRWHGATKADFVKVECRIHQGTVEDARWYSYAANQTHGLRRTNQDKVKAVKAALRHPTGVKLSNEQIAEHVGVDPTTVAKYRKALTATQEIPESTKRTGRDGRTTDTANIGRKPARPERDPESFQEGRCKSPGVTEDCDCDACQELAMLPEDQRAGAFREACERFQTQYPKAIEIRQVVNMWADADDAGEDAEEPEEEEDGSDVEEAGAEAAAWEPEPKGVDLLSEVRKAVMGVWAEHREISKVTIRAMLLELADECERWQE